jgi:hypothetical protein
MNNLFDAKNLRAIVNVILGDLSMSLHVASCNWPRVMHEFANEINQPVSFISYTLAYSK